MSLEDVRAGRIVPAAAGMLLYRHPKEGGIEILTGIRKNEPWKDYHLVVFEGLIKSEDENALLAAHREAHEETGEGLKIEVPHQFPICILGPNSYHHKLIFNARGEPKAVKTDQRISDEFYFCILVYAGRIVGGEPKDNREVDNFSFIDPVELARRGTSCAFEQALVVQQFYQLKIDYALFTNPRLRDSIFSTPI